MSGKVHDPVFFTAHSLVQSHHYLRTESRGQPESVIRSARAASAQIEIGEFRVRLFEIRNGRQQYVSGDIVEPRRLPLPLP